MDSNPMQYLRFLEIQRKNVGTMARLVFQKILKCAEKNNKKETNDFDNEFEKYSQNDGGYSFVVALETHAG